MSELLKTAAMVCQILVAEQGPGLTVEQYQYEMARCIKAYNKCAEVPPKPIVEIFKK